MFFLKDGKKRLPIECDNVFVKCCRCGREETVDLADFVIDNTLDLYANWYCWKCAPKVRSNPPMGT